MFARRCIELSLAAAIALLAAVLAFAAPAFFRPDNLIDLALANAPMLVVAIGATVVLLAGEIDISCGSTFALASVAAGALAVAGVPVGLALAAGVLVGAAVGLVNGLLVARAGIPSIVVTLAMMGIVRDALRWSTQGAWVQGLPASFQWFGLPARVYPVVAVVLALGLAAIAAWILRALRAGRMVYAAGGNATAAILAGIPVPRVKAAVFVVAGALTGAAAVLNSVRFDQIPVNTGLGLELRVIAAVVVGGTAITGGRGSITGTVLGVVLLGMIGPALTFLGASPYWEQALQGAIILAAVLLDALRRHSGAGVAGGRSGARAGAEA